MKEYTMTLHLRFAFSALALAGALAGTAQAADTAPLKIYAAGSLTGALTAVAEEYTRQTGQPIAFAFGPAGLMRERIEKGEPADLFASANMAHPQTLADAGLATAPVVMARNRLCARALPDFHLDSEHLLQQMLAPGVHILTSTPKADPGGDYAWMIFARAEKLQPGAQAALEARARQLVGGAHDAPIPAGQDALHYYAAQKMVDLSLGYCSSRKTTPDTGVTTVELPPGLAVTADYGLSVLTKNADPARREAAYRFALFVMGPTAQRIMSAYGYVPVTDLSKN
jgi:molybdenum ABC transporter molybdate-binding protein